MEKLGSGKIVKIKRKLRLSIAETIKLKNDTKHDLFFEVEEMPDGVKPNIILKIRRAIKRRKRK